MRYVVFAVSILYALLSLYASVGFWKHPARRRPALLMTLGSLILIAAAILEITAWGPAWLVVVIGSLLICQAALMVGKQTGRDKLQNHAVRFLITVFLILGAAFW